MAKTNSTASRVARKRPEEEGSASAPSSATKPKVKRLALPEENQPTPAGESKEEAPVRSGIATLIEGSVYEIRGRTFKANLPKVVTDGTLLDILRENARFKVVEGGGAEGGK